MAGVPRVDNFFVILPLVARVVGVGSPPPRKAAATLCAILGQWVMKE